MGIHDAVRINCPAYGRAFITEDPYIVSGTTNWVADMAI